MKTIRIHRNGRVTGMSLLEVMIAVVIFSVGLIGVAALMLTSMRNNDATLSRTQSTILATEMYEKMLANLPGVKAGNYTYAFADTLPTTASPSCDTADCDTAQLAAWDVAAWAARINQVLVNPDAGIAVDILTNPNLMTIQISIRYDELMETAGVTTETFTFRARQ